MNNDCDYVWSFLSYFLSFELACDFCGILFFRDLRVLTYYVCEL